MVSKSTKVGRTCVPRNAEHQRAAETKQGLGWTGRTTPNCCKITTVIGLTDNLLANCAGGQPHSSHSKLSSANIRSLNSSGYSSIKLLMPSATLLLRFLASDFASSTLDAASDDGTRKRASTVRCKEQVHKKYMHRGVMQGRQARTSCFLLLEFERCVQQGSLLLSRSLSHLINEAGNQFVWSQQMGLACTRDNCCSCTYRRFYRLFHLTLVFGFQSINFVFMSLL